MLNVTRLDVALVERKLVSSRSRAQRAIRLGLVVVNGRVINKPSFQVKPRDGLAVASTADKPSGYWKLMQVQNACTLINAGDTVLDIGSSAGGFMLYALERANSVYAVEFNADLKRALDLIARQHPGKITVLQADAFTYDFHRLAGFFDVILNDVTAEPEASLRLLARCSIALKCGGRVLQVLKGKLSEEAKDRFKSSVEDMGFDILCILPSPKDELFIVGKKKRSVNAEEGI
ncbi:MAG: S4 domain-containing protein [Halobacteriota archaeon]